MANSNIKTQVLGSIQKPEQWPRIIDILQECKYYAYIYHDSDIDDDTKKLKTKHLHFVCEGRHSLKRWAELFGIPENMVELPKVSFRSCNRYLIHLDDKSKFQYDKSQVFTNKPLRFESYLQDNKEITPTGLFSDMQKVYKGGITSKDFIEKYKFYLNSQSFYCQFKIYMELLKHE